MAFKIKDIENLIINGENESSLAKTITEYLTLKQKIEDVDSQSWYFVQGLESHKNKLLTLKINYEEIREFFNGSSIDCFIDEINENTNKIKEYRTRRWLNTIARIHISAMTNKNAFLNELIRLKSKSDLLIPIDDYSENPEEFMKFIE